MQSAARDGAGGSERPVGVDGARRRRAVTATAARGRVTRSPRMTSKPSSPQKSPRAQINVVISPAEDAMAAVTVICSPSVASSLARAEAETAPPAAADVSCPAPAAPSISKNASIRLVTTFAMSHWSANIAVRPDAGTRLTETRQTPRGVSRFAHVFTKLLLGGQVAHDDELEKGMKDGLDRIKAIVEARYA